MPKKTFFNLPDTKRQKIIDTAYELFINNDYKDINIRKLASSFEISLGSFYQYFENKDDLYLYLICDIETKIYQKEVAIYGNYLYRRDGIPLEDLCTEREIAFDGTWIKAPVEVWQKFYFGKYSKDLHEGVLEEFQSYKNKGYLKDWVDINFLFHMYTTLMFNTLIYFRENNIVDREEQFKIKITFFFDTLFHGIFKEIPNDNNLFK
jgi:hypothetical protein